MFRAGDAAVLLRTAFPGSRNLREGFDLSMCLKKAFRKSKRTVARQSAALDFKAAFKDPMIARVCFCVIGVLWVFEI